MAEAIDIAYVEIRPDLAGFGRDLRSDLKREIAIAERSAEVDVRSRVTGGGLKGAKKDLGGITASTATLGKASTLTAGAVGGLAGRLGTLGAAGAAVGGIAAVGLALKSTADAAIAFEDSFAGVVKTVGGDPLQGGATAQELEVLAGQFRAMAREIPISVNEINSIGEAAGALGIKKEGIVEFTETVAKLGVTTDLSSDAAADALARIGNITNLPSDQFDNLASSIVALGNSTASTESEIVEFTQRLSGAGTTIGLSQGEIAGFGAALASAGVEAEAGGTAFSTLFVKIARSAEKGGKSIEGFANVAGVSGEEFQKQFAEDPAKAIVRFIQGLSQVEKAGGSTFGTLEELGLGGARIRQSLLNAANAQEVFAGAITTGNKAFKENSALNKEASVRFGTTASQIQIFKNNINDLQISIGNALLPAINRTVGGLIRFVNALRANEGVGKAIREIFGLIGGAISEVASVFRDRGDDIKTAMQDIGVVIQRSVTIAVAVLKPLIALFTFGLKVAINNSITTLKVFAKAWRVLSDVIVKVIGVVITVLDKFLGGIAAMADAASHIPFVGDKFKGVSDKINESRETLRGLNDELNGLDGKVVNTTVQVTVRTITQRPTGRPGAPGGIGLEDIPSVAGAGTAADGDLPTPIIPRVTHKGIGEKAARKRSEELQADVEEARLLDESTANDKVALRALIAFSKEQATNENLKVEVRREFYLQQLQAQADLRSIYQAEGDAAQAAADEAKAAADERDRTREQERQTRIQERESTLRTNLEIARLTVKNLADDRLALRQLIAFYKVRIGQVGAYTAAGRQYLLAKKQATAELKGLAEQERADRKEERQARLDAEGERLADRRTLAELTRKTLKDDEAAIRAEIAYFRKRKNLAKKGTAERRKWLIEERRAQNDLADLLAEKNETDEKTADSFKTQTFDFLQKQQGFAAGLMSNLVGFGDAAGLLTTAAEAAPGGAAGPRAGGGRDPEATGLPRTPGANLTEAQAAREDRKGLTQGQAEQLITIQRQMLNVLTDIRRGSSAPEARGAALAARHATEII